MSAPVIIEIHVEANPSDEPLVFTAAEWAAMTPLERGLALEDAVDTAIGNAGGAGWHIVSGASDDDVATPPSIGGLIEACDQLGDEVQALREERNQLRRLVRDALRAIHSGHAPVPAGDCTALICRNLAAAIRPPALPDPPKADLAAERMAKPGQLNSIHPGLIDRKGGAR